ncbi:MAG: T9SS C-terminal target domain-containing protein [Bacteroidetes bacterium]|nr:MAG: T9SS C-terminal target domain-containing protein [Bacteroidota bacterium]
MKKNLFLLLAICISQLIALNVSAFIAGGSSTATDGSGNVYVMGYIGDPSVTFGTITLTNNGGYDMYIVKYDASGNVLWAKSAGGSNNDCGYGIATDGSGNVYVLGDFTSSSITFGTIKLTNAASGKTDMFIVKYDPSGNVVWAKRAGTIHNSGMALSHPGHQIVTDGSGNVYVDGSFDTPSVTFGTTTLTNAGTAGSDMFLVRYNANDGSVVWAKSAGGSGNDVGQGIAADGSGNVYVTGHFSSSSLTFGTTKLTNAGSDDIFIVKYDVTGNAIWAASAGGSNSDYSNGITTDGSGNSYVTGGFMSTSISFGETTLNNTVSGKFDMFIVKYGAEGNVLWAKSAGGSANDQGMSISTNGNGNVFVTGGFLSSSITFGTTTLINKGTGCDMFIVKYYANDGSVLWAKSAGGSSTDNGMSIGTDGIGNVFVTGLYMSTSIIFGTITLNNPEGGTSNGYDMFIAKYDANGTVPWAKTAGVKAGKPKSADAGINDAIDNEITVYPNPTSGKFTVSTSNTQPAINSISVFNITGKEVLIPQFTAGSSEVTVDLSSQPKGLYIVLIKTGDSCYSKKIIVE